MKKSNFEYRATSARASRLYQAMIAAFPELRSRAQWLICLKAAAKMTDAEAAEIVFRYSSASGIWAMMPETEKIETVQKLAATLPARAERLSAAQTFRAIENGKNARARFPHFVQWMLDKRGNVTAASVEIVAGGAWLYIDKYMARADETGKSYVAALMDAVQAAAQAEYRFRNPGAHSRNGGPMESLDALNESGEKLGTDGDRAISRTTENSALNRARISEALNGKDGEILRLYAMGYKSAEMEKIVGIPAAAIRQKIHRFQARNGGEN